MIKLNNEILKSIIENNNGQYDGHTISIVRYKQDYNGVDYICSYSIEPPILERKTIGILNRTTEISFRTCIITKKTYDYKYSQNRYLKLKKIKDKLCTK